jgi:plastocyanin
MRKVICSLILALAAQGALAKKIVIHQKDKNFDKKEVKAKIGDVLVFQNDDPFQHNVYSLSKGNSFEIQTQEPESSSELVLSADKFKGGKMDIECAIHPNMKLSVEIGK